MKTWKKLILQYENETISSSPTHRERHISGWRGRSLPLSLSPVLFFLALSTLSFVSNLTTCGYDIMNGTIKHLVGVDALKTFAENSEQQTRLLSTLRTFSNGIKMELSLQN